MNGLCIAARVNKALDFHRIAYYKTIAEANTEHTQIVTVGQSCNLRIHLLAIEKHVNFTLRYLAGTTIRQLLLDTHFSLILDILGSRNAAKQGVLSCHVRWIG